MNIFYEYKNNFNKFVQLAEF